uniref:Uncharacterized protein n=1 Tax=Salmonella phage vB_SEnST11_KE22 TaxID=3161173 RepID=A0AAU8GHM3_9CAUD
MKYKYRIITGLRPNGKEVYILQLRPRWLPIWVEMDWFWYEEEAIARMELEKKKDAYKGKVIRLG